ncbi:hypothetical protein I7I53_07638 [Histoplasma capsulatum var. duboisii H88]|uniref:Uncharacterized protein n=1 Tax=Ajellomyces capsulatus (strain H88) TaxID=544711 RepID=A0A8A1LE67_AJEC8|nr:hypothetical protein I7I53_07638 [Histoplasma capsulatum var. duboisii H88]
MQQDKMKDKKTLLSPFPFLFYRSLREMERKEERNWRLCIATTVRQIPAPYPEDKISSLINIW